MPEKRISRITEPAIHIIRGQRVMLDSDLAEIYGTSTMRLNEQFRRNRTRFPVDFSFVLTRQEFISLISQFAISKKGRAGRRQPPVVFTEHGAIMLASILNRFHVRENGGAYRVRRRKQIATRNSEIRNS